VSPEDLRQLATLLAGMALGLGVWAACEALDRPQREDPPGE
jgi:hypothetical protein